MEDQQIVQLYWDRDEDAISVTAEKYGGGCRAVARNILECEEDAEECVSDTWLAAWNAIPPHRPAVLGAFLARLTRNLAFNRRKRERADKRGGGTVSLVLDELGECVSGREDVEAEVDRRELVRAIDEFLAGLTPEKRGIFLCRYWWSDSMGDIAKRYGMREGAVSMALSRLRAKLRRHLTERGFDV